MLACGQTLVQENEAQFLPSGRHGWVEESEKKTCDYISGCAESRGKRQHDILIERVNSSVRVEHKLQGSELEREAAKSLLG